MISEKGSQDVSSTVGQPGVPIVPTPSGQKPEAPRIGVAQMQQESAPSPSFGPTEETSTKTAVDGNIAQVASPGRMDEDVGNDEDPQATPDPQKPRRQETDPGEIRPDKALTYPGPLPNYPQADRRRNTHSGFGRDSESKSPSSTKKHQCK